MLIRRAVPDDAAEILDILNPIIDSGLYTVIDGPLSLEYEQKFIETFPSRGVFFVAVSEKENKVIGFQSIEPFSDFHAFSHVAGIATFVELSRRRNGVGTLLSKAAFKAARQNSIEKIFSYVRADNPSSLQFHLKLGFEIVGTARRHAKIHGAYVDEIVIEKFL